MNFIKKEDGFSLAELILAVFIMAIIIVAFTNLITVSIQGIFGAGSKSSALFDAQERMDNYISGGLSGEYDPENPNVHVIDFGDGLMIPVDGEEKPIEYEHEDREGVLYYFLPHYVPVFGE